MLEAVTITNFTNEGNISGQKIHKYAVALISNPDENICYFNSIV